MEHTTCPVCGFVDDGYSHYADCPMLDLSEADQTAVHDLAISSLDYLEITIQPHFTQNPYFSHRLELLRLMGWVQ